MKIRLRQIIRLIFLTRSDTTITHKQYPFKNIHPFILPNNSSFTTEKIKPIIQFPKLHATYRFWFVDLSPPPYRSNPQSRVNALHNIKLKPFPPEKKSQFLNTPIIPTCQTLIFRTKKNSFLK